jgi:hypothetical protein
MATEKRLIDANELMEIIQEAKKEADLQIVEYVLQKFCDMLDKSPTVDAAEVVHGRWDDGECNACGFDIRDMIDGESDFRSWVWDGVPYCPNCGAKMDGDGNG